VQELERARRCGELGRGKDKSLSALRWMLMFRVYWVEVQRGNQGRVHFEDFGSGVRALGSIFSCVWSWGWWSIQGLYGVWACRHFEIWKHPGAIWSS